MQQPLQITIRDIDHSDAVEQHLREKVDKMDSHCKDIVSCRIAIEQTQRHQEQGKLHNIHIVLHLPKQKLVVDRSEEENLYIAVRDAFDHMQRKLKSVMEKYHGDVKPHADFLLGNVVRKFEDFGFIESLNGEEFYFNSGHLKNIDFGKVEVGMDAHFVPFIGVDGLQAHSVKVSKK